MIDRNKISVCLSVHAFLGDRFCRFNVQLNVRDSIWPKYVANSVQASVALRSGSANFQHVVLGTLDGFLVALLLISVHASGLCWFVALSPRITLPSLMLPLSLFLHKMYSICDSAAPLLYVIVCFSAFSI